MSQSNPMRSSYFGIPVLVLACVVYAGAVVSPPSNSANPANSPVADLVVYGGTASGVMTAYAAAREGLRVVLLEPGAHVGGMVTGGLSATDSERFTIIGGYPRDFFAAAADHYGVATLDRREDWLSEPHVGEAIFGRMIAEAGVDLRLGERLREHGGVERDGNRIIALTTEDGQRWPAKVFADCSYEGDLMAQAQVTYTWGRESSAEYGESLGGVRDQTPAHQFLWRLSGYDPQHHLLPEISPAPLAPAGSADKAVQAYNLRVILSDDPANEVPFTRPEGYDPSEFALLARYLGEFRRHEHRAPRLTDVTNPVRIPNHKADFNNNGPVSTDFIGHSWGYPNGTYAERATIASQHLHYVQSFFYFLSHDKSVPASLRAELNRWGLARDEFADHGNWPSQLYIREGRRMIGEYVMRQSDLQNDLRKSDAVGMGSYNSDSHNVQRVVLADGSVQNEGDTEVPTTPYEIPYRIMLPKRSQANNLLVPVCFSATHVAYSSVRMEPQYMILGQAAGTAAALTVHDNVPVQDVPIAKLQAILREHQAILHRDEEYSRRPEVKFHQVVERKSQ